MGGECVINYTSDTPTLPPEKINKKSDLNQYHRVCQDMNFNYTEEMVKIVFKSGNEVLAILTGALWCMPTISTTQLISYPYGLAISLKIILSVNIDTEF